MGIHDFGVYDLISRNARIFKDKPAWLEVEQNQTLTFAELKIEVDRLAQALQAAGFQKGERIGIVGKNCLAYFLLYGAAAALGGIVVPVNWRLSVEEAAYNLNDTQPRWVFVESEDSQWIAALQKQMAPETVFYNLQPGQGPLADITPAAASAEAFAPNPVGSEDGLVIIHTAAVAGRPRGAVLSHHNLLCTNLHLINTLAMTARDVHLNILPMYHVAGLCMILQSFHAGSLNINVPKFEVSQTLQLIARHGVSLIFEFPPILKSILDAQAKSQTEIRSLRSVIGLDEPETIQRYEQATGGSYFTMYGQTETSLLASLGRYQDCPGAAGRPIALASVQVVDDADRPVECGQVGEIVMQGPMVFQGYWGLEAETAFTFRNGWHHTGDMGRLDADGFLWFTGRKADKELIKPGGENVYPAEVEMIILQHPAVEAAVVFGVPDPKWKEGIKAVCALKPGQTLTTEELIAFVGGRIARYKKPQYVDFAPELPVTADGAIDRQKVKEIYGGNQPAPNKNRLA